MSYKNKDTDLIMDDKKIVKILQIGMTDNIGGMETYLMAQYRKMNRSKVRYHFLNHRNDDHIAFEEEILDNGDSIYRVPQRKKSPLKHWWNVLKLLYHYRNEYSYIVLNVCELSYVFPLFAAKLVGIPHRIIHSHNSGNEILATDGHFGFMRRLMISFNRLLLKFSATDYWACSNLAGKWMFGKNISFRVIHNAIDIEKFYYQPQIRDDVRHELNIPPNAYVIGNIARISYQKNQEFLIEVFREISIKDNDALLLLVGGDNGRGNFEKKIRDLVSQYHLNNRVIFLGMREDANRIFQAMDCFVLTSRFEGLCISAIEAQTSCLPCVCSDVLPQEAVITNRFYPISLSATPIEWAELILKQKYKERYDVRDEIRKSGYDIATEVKKMEKIYTEE